MIGVAVGDTPPCSAPSRSCSRILVCLVAAAGVCIIGAGGIQVSRMTSLGFRNDVRDWTRKVIGQEHGVVTDVRVSGAVQQVSIFISDKWWRISLEKKREFLTAKRREIIGVYARHGVWTGRLTLYIRSGPPREDPPSADAVNHPMWGEINADETRVTSPWSTAVFAWKTEK